MEKLLLEEYLTKAKIEITELLRDEVTNPEGFNVHAEEALHHVLENYKHVCELCKHVTATVI